VIAIGCGTDPAIERPTRFGGERIVDLQVPAGFDDDRRYPLALVLHGYSINGFLERGFLGMAALTTSGDAFVLAPNGLPDGEGKPFWNADPACCDFDGLAPDDVGFLTTLVDEVTAVWPIDRDRVFLIGHANGGFMAYRLACEQAARFPRIVVIAGAASLDPAACAPAQPVSVLHLHGTADPEFPYEGGGLFGATPDSPGAVASTERWAAYGGCGATRSSAGADVELDDVVTGPETRREAYDGCPAGTCVELWSQVGSDHLPVMARTFVPTVWPWLAE
jgi:polyhydroxybutyrate depolymerase